MSKQNKKIATKNKSTPSKLPELGPNTSILVFKGWFKPATHPKKCWNPQLASARMLVGPAQTLVHSG